MDRLSFYHIYIENVFKFANYIVVKYFSLEDM